MSPQDVGCLWGAEAREFKFKTRLGCRTRLCLGAGAMKKGKDGDTEKM